MAKILDSTFRKELYKNLMDAGYDKQESQRIVGVQYKKALLELITSELNAQIARIHDGDYTPINVEEINISLGELAKIAQYE